MRTFAIAALVAAVAAEVQYGAAINQGWEADLVARGEDCTSSSPLVPVAAAVTSSTPMPVAAAVTSTGCPSQVTTHVTITNTFTVTAGTAEPTTTSTVKCVTTQYTTVTKTVQRPSGILPSGSGIPINRNSTTQGFAHPTLSATPSAPPQFTGAAAVQGTVPIAALFLGVAAAANLV